MLAALDGVIIEEEPDLVLVYGDTNSTLAGALAAVQHGVRLAHVEAGMRSFDRRMPEEVNRVLTDAVSDLLLCSSGVAAENLRRESAHGEIVEVGDVMVDVAELFRPRAAALEPPVAVEAGFVLATFHRAGNVDDPARLERVVAMLEAIEEQVVLPLHPRTKARLEAAGLLGRLQAGTTLLPPLGPLSFAALLMRARAVLTDSGGVQKEAYLAGVPCVTLRDSTEWVETVAAGWNVLVDLDAAAAHAALGQAPPAQRPQLYGDGHAADRVVAAMARLRR